MKKWLRKKLGVSAIVPTDDNKYIEDMYTGGRYIKFHDPINDEISLYMQKAGYIWSANSKYLHAADDAEWYFETRDILTTRLHGTGWMSIAKLDTSRHLHVLSFVLSEYSDKGVFYAYADRGALLMPMDVLNDFQDVMMWRNLKDEFDTFMDEITTEEAYDAG